MKKIKKYYLGVSGLTYDNSKSVGVLAPKQEDPNKFTTGKFLFPEQKTLGKITDNKVMSQDYLSSKGPSFMDKAGDFMGNYGNIIGSVGTGIASLINANKKQDPTGRPYKTGTNMIKTKKRNLIKYQAGTEDLIGPGPLDNLSEMTPEQLKAFNAYENQRDIQEAIQRVNPLTAPISPLTPKMASIRMPQQALMSPRLNKVPVEKQSRRERKAENERLFKMVRKDESPIEPLMPKMARISPEIPVMQPSLKKVEIETPSKRPKFFDYHSAEAKGGYARALKSGIKTKEG
jgi:hypothetical protein